MVDKTIWATATKECRAMGWTLKATGYGCERVAYPKGKNEEYPASYYSECPVDMIITVRLFQ